MSAAAKAERAKIVRQILARVAALDIGTVRLFSDVIDTYEAAIRWTVSPGLEDLRIALVLIVARARDQAAATVSARLAVATVPAGRPPGSSGGRGESDARASSGSGERSIALIAGWLLGQRVEVMQNTFAVKARNEPELKKSHEERANLLGLLAAEIRTFVPDDHADGESVFTKFLELIRDSDLAGTPLAADLRALPDQVKANPRYHAPSGSGAS